MWLLNHAKAEHSTPQHIRPRHYGPEVQHALFLAWHAANRISGQTPRPLSPHIGRSGLRGMSTSTSTPECRSQLLSMSAATADRRLAFPAQRRSARPLDDASWNAPKAADSERAPTRSGTRPDLVFWKRNGRAHCGSEIEGDYLYTLTLTDIATGWTECLPLMHRSREAVLAALQRARTLFPFQFLGFDTDNGGEADQ